MNPRRLVSLLACALALVPCASRLPAKSPEATGASALQRVEDEHRRTDNRNQPAREAWLQDAGFGMFIHFSVDSQLGITISHSLVGASEDYRQRFFDQLPRTFSPDKFDARAIARLARLAGMKYVVLTTKHHSGFCLWDTATTGFNIMQTPYGHDLLKDFVEAVRAEGLAVGLYYSPEDFLFLHEQGVAVTRNHKTALPEKMMAAYVDLIRRQCIELMTRYGQIDLFFIDGEPSQPVRDTVWNAQPSCLITRGAIATPEQNLPGVPIEQAWESCVTMGVAWQYQPTNENHKSGARLIQLLIETRAKGGALLLNIGPRPDGALVVEQEANLREVAAWYFVNHEAVDGVRPWIVTNEGPIWFTRRKDNGAVLAIIPQQTPWDRGERREFTLHSIETTAETKISVLGQNDSEVEYQPKVDPRSTFRQTADGVLISVVRAQRLYDNNRWPNPIVVKLEAVKPALVPPVVKTLPCRSENGKIKLNGELVRLAPGDKVEVGFLCRPAASFADKLYNQQPWAKVSAGEKRDSGTFSAEIDAPAASGSYEIRAFVRHPKLLIEGDTVQVGR
jgi:alpha-L-fucosidase